MLVGGQQAADQTLRHSERRTTGKVKRGVHSRGACLTVRVHGLLPRGDLMVALFDESSPFPKREKATVTQTFPVTTQQASVQFKSGFGAPTEPYGFSNNARSNFGPPSFQAAVFKLAEGSQDTHVTLQ